MCRSRCVPSLKNSPMNENKLIEIQDVCLSYGERHVLCHIRNVVCKDDFIVLKGPNGGGKTTLLRLLAGLLPPTRGKIVRSPHIILGYLPQYRHIDRSFPITVSDIVMSGLQCRKKMWQRYTEEHRQQTRETLGRFELADLAERPISDLSGGQWQRTLLARATVAQPDLLLLDEPETHLDEASRTELYGYLTDLQEQCAIVVVSHDEHHFPRLEKCRYWDVDNGNVTESSTW